LDTYRSYYTAVITEGRKKEDSVPEYFQICPNLFQAGGKCPPASLSPTPMFNSMQAVLSESQDFLYEKYTNKACL